MVKKLALFCNVLLFAGIFFFFAVYRKQPDTPSSLASGSLSVQVQEANALYQSLPKTLETKELRVCFREEELACDRSTNTFYLPVNMDKPTWEAGTFTEISKELEVLPLEDYTTFDKKKTVAEGSRVLFLVWDKKADSCATIDVVFTGLSITRIETDANLEIDTVFAGSVVFYQDCGQRNWTLTSAFQAKERGQTTREFPKKGYRLNLISITPTGVVKENKKSVLGMRSSDSWIFYAIYSDESKVRDKLNIELWNEFGASPQENQVHFGTHMEYTELFVNGEYRGLYGILEPIDSTQLSIFEHEYLYKRTYGRELRSELFDEVPTEEYLGVLGMEIKGREEYGSKADWECFRRFVELCEKDDEDFAEEAEILLDIDNFTDIWLYLQMIYGEDNIYKNMFFAFKKETRDYRLYLIPWDVDLSWGNIYVDDGEKLYTTYAPERASAYLKWPFADRVLSLDVGGVKSLAAKKWQTLREGTLSEEHIEEVLLECTHLVQDSGAFARDATRWPLSPHSSDTKNIRMFMEERMVFMDAYMDKIEVE